MNMNFFTRAFQESNYSVLVLLISNKKGRDVLEHYSSPAQLSVFGSRAFSAVSRPGPVSAAAGNRAYM